MHSKLTLSYVLGFAWIIHAPHILARPLMPRQATVTLLVLNDSVDKKLGCSAAQDCHPSKCTHRRRQSLYDCRKHAV
ncbi:hypothetical protein BD410DRAFT_789362 [Rickenella mellea]|uniref:Secreted protein n=1 Tax=Rickenella mellea TaxID=50990 RepID=A0A4Y7Q2Q8_9AGAM|nr:hypothetical protein BD410DRAFT_789362 [Rickenella mellea]